MRLRLLANGSLALTRIGPLELDALMRIPHHADAGNTPEAERRLYQKPIIEDKGDDFEGTARLEEDWQDIVVPELKKLFDGAMERVREDLGRLTAETPPRRRKSGAQENSAGGEDEPDSPAEDDPPLTLRLTIPAEHIEDWFRAMNQARLVMAEKELWVDDGTGIHGPLLMRIHYETYTAFQQWLVENVMS